MEPTESTEKQPVTTAGEKPGGKSRSIEELIENNRSWSERMVAADPNYFNKLVHQQTPKFLWIGCSDSRVPANEIVDLLPGELFVHRNVANLVYSADLNCLSVIEYAVKVLKVEHILVVGHYGCGGVRAAMENQSHGIIDNWLNSIRGLYAKHREDLHALPTESLRVNRLCELNVIEQVKAVSHTTIVQEAWAANQPLEVHGWIYGVHNGLVNELGIRVSTIKQVPNPFRIISGPASV